MFERYKEDIQCFMGTTRQPALLLRSCCCTRVLRPCAATAKGAVVLKSQNAVYRPLYQPAHGAQDRDRDSSGRKIGRRVCIDHGNGIVIGETTEVGDDVMIYQGVTLGGGTGKDLGKRHPTIENGVMIGSGAKVLGPITIGRNAKVAAGAVVVKDVEPNCTVVGVPGEVVRIDGERVDDLDQINLPDPVMNAIQQNEAKINALQAEIEKLKEQLK